VGKSTELEKNKMQFNKKQKLKIESEEYPYCFEEEEE
jgi:hypothetical protein